MVAMVTPTGVPGTPVKPGAPDSPCKHRYKVMQVFMLHNCFNEKNIIKYIFHRFQDFTT